MIEKTNYILHLNRAFAMFCDDDRLSPYHISLYFALFQYWNLAKFRNPISISRDEIMRACRIGSVNTYIRSMKELHEWKYIQYQPSYNPLKGSKVHMFNFDNANTKSKNNGNTISADNSTKKAKKKTPAKATETLMSPSKNNSNSINKTNKSKPNKHESIRSKNNEEFLRLRGQEDLRGRKRKIAPKEKASGHVPLNEGAAKVRGTFERAGAKAGRGRKDDSSRSSRPLLSKVKGYFTKKRWPVVEAQKFFNYYKSNGWLVGGKTPMQDWKAAADNWMLNTKNFTYDEKESRPERSRRATGNLHATTTKNYSEPL